MLTFPTMPTALNVSFVLVECMGPLCGEYAGEMPGNGSLLLKLDQQAHVAGHQICKKSGI